MPPIRLVTLTRIGRSGAAGLLTQTRLVGPMKSIERTSTGQAIQARRAVDRARRTIRRFDAQRLRPDRDRDRRALGQLIQAWIGAEEAAEGRLDTARPVRAAALPGAGQQVVVAEEGGDEARAAAGSRSRRARRSARSRHRS